MAKAKISSKDFLDLLDEQSDQPAAVWGSPTPKPDQSKLHSPTPAEAKPVQKTGNKAATNREQTGNKTDNKLATNREQTGDAAYARDLTKAETGNKVGTQPATHSATKWQQSENKPATTAAFSGLVGLQRAVLIVVYDACKAARGRVSEPLTLEHLANCLKTSTGSVKTTLQRLESKSCILRVTFKNGRGGWSRYELPEAIFRELLQLETENKLATNWQQTENKVGTQPATQPTTSPSSSSSSIDLQKLKTTTTDEPELFESTATQLSPDWSAVDFSALTEIGFTQSHLVQLAKHGKLSATEVQDSIHFFAFDLKRNGKGREIKGPPVNFFMGILRKGLPYAPPENYESPEQAARRSYLDGKRRIEAERLAEERELRDLEFGTWRRGLTREQVAAIVPDVVLDIVPARESSLKTHFDEQVWPERCAAMPGVVVAEHEDIRRQVEQSLREVTG